MNASVILLVSDSPSDIVATQNLIARAGLESPVVVAHDGPEALRLLQGDAPRPSMILLDLKTPLMNGFDFVIHVRADPLTRDVPVAVLPTVTERTTTGELLSGEEHPHDQAFPKPRSTQELFAALKALGVSWLGAGTDRGSQSSPSHRRTGPGLRRRLKARAARGPAPEVRAS